MSISVTDTLYNTIKKNTPSNLFPSLNLFLTTGVTGTPYYRVLAVAGVTTIPSYGVLNPNSFMENKTASRFTHNLDDSVILCSNSATNVSIYTSIQKNEGLKKVNGNVEYEDDTEDLLDWDIWIENPPVSKTITVNAQFIKGNFILPSIDEDLEG